MLELAAASYPGVYRGLVIDNNDPEALGRVRLMVPQVSGEQVTGWAWPIGGGIGQINYPYGTFVTLSNQAISGTTTVSNWTLEDGNKTSVSGTKLYVEESGDYMLQFSVMLTRSSASSTTADVWVNKNGTAIPRSNSRVTISGSDAETLMTVAFILDLDAGDYIELVAYSPATNVSIVYHAASTGPAIPGVIATLSLIGKYKPKPNTPVWVTFEGGDPNFPLWMGAS